MRLLVTGGLGFIGANFVRHILNKYEDSVIINLDKLTYAGNPMNLQDIQESLGGTRYHFAKGDIGNFELVSHLIRTHKPDAVVNFAAETHVDRSINDSSPFIKTNIEGTHQLLEASRLAGVPRFVHVSTDEVYGTLGETGKFSEETPLAPNSPYSASKAASDMLVRAAYHTFGYDTVITRCSNNYGPYQFPEKLIPLMYLKTSRGEALPVYGTGANVRDWIYVLDHCLGVELALLKGAPGAVYNFGGDAEMRNLEVVKTILDELGKPQTLIKFVKDRPGHDLRYAMDFSLAARELGFKPQYDFKRGIKQTLDWYRANPDWLAKAADGSYREFMDKWYEERR